MSRRFDVCDKDAASHKDAASGVSTRRTRSLNHLFGLILKRFHLISPSPKYQLFEFAESFDEFVEWLCKFVERLCELVERLREPVERLRELVERLCELVERLCELVERLCERGGT